MFTLKRRYLHTKVLRALGCAAWVFFWFGGSTVSVHAEMAPNFPHQHHTWLHDLYQTRLDGARGEHCCSDADCWLIVYRIRAGVPEGNSGYQVYYRGEWLDVPTDRVVRRGDNPTGNAVLCINSNNKHIYCFIPGPEG